MENILNKINLSQCTGCGLCEFVCPKKCISVSENKQGFFKVTINNLHCVNCGLCSDVCHNLKTITHNNFRIYGGRAKEEGVVENSRSGGLFYLLSKRIIEDGGIAIGAAFVDDFDVKHIAVDNINDLWKLQGSKYVQSNFKDAFQIVKEANKAGRIVIVGGTACQIAALTSFCNYYNLDFSKIILVDVVCFGTPSRVFLRDYLGQYKKYGIIGFDFRDKSFGWESHKESCYTKLKGKIVSSEFANAFSSFLILSDNCFICKYKNVNRPGDITLADFWGLKKRYPLLYNEKGNSLFFINNNNGLKAFHLIEDKINFFEIDKEDSFWVQPALKENWKKPGNYEKFWNDYKKHSFNIIHKKYFTHKNSLIARLIHFINKKIRRN